MKTCDNIKRIKRWCKCCEFIEFEKSLNTSLFVKGETYHYINEFGNEEKGECISYDEKTGKVKLKNLKQ